MIIPNEEYLFNATMIAKEACIMYYSDKWYLERMRGCFEFQLLDGDIVYDDIEMEHPKLNIYLIHFNKITRILRGNEFVIVRINYK